jgi:hypothetical protein
LGVRSGSKYLHKLAGKQTSKQETTNMNVPLLQKQGPVECCIAARLNSVNKNAVRKPIEARTAKGRF